jgi:hypothetical protein
MSLGLPTSNNWDWAETLKNSFTLIEIGPLHKNGLLSLSVTRVKHTKKSEWQHTQNKKWMTTHSRKISTTAQEKWAQQLKNRLQEYHEGSSWENRDKLDWA